MVRLEQLKEIAQRIEAIEGYLKIKEKRMQLSEEELKTQDPSFWDDAKKAESQMKAIRGLKFWIETYDQLKSSFDDLEVLMDFFKEGEVEESEVDQSYETLLKEVEELELKNMLSGEEDGLSAVLQITAGAGGAVGGGAGGGEPVPSRPGVAGTANTGGASGGNSASFTPPAAGLSLAGGSGFVAIRYKFQN